MYNQKLIKMVKGLFMGFIAVLCIVLGYSIAQVQQNLRQNSQVQEEAKQKPEEKQQEQLSLTEQQVEDFLIAYYTKKDLEENRPRYKPFMTDSMYQETVQEEQKPVNQTYKGYVVDQAFESGAIYIDKQHKIALAQVQYTSTTLTEKDNRASKGLTGSTKATIRLTYVEKAGKLLINKIEPIVLTEARGQSVGTYADTSSSSSTPVSSTSTATPTSSEPTTATSSNQ